MPPPTGKTSRPTLAVLLGLAATVLVVAGRWTGLDRRAELAALDFRFRNAPAPPNADILHVDIDDGSLTELGRWPWQRELLAGIIQTLRDCGAQAVALDIILPEPQEVRYVSAAGDIYSSASAELADITPPLPVFDDDALSSAIQAAEKVLVPMHMDFDAAVAEEPYEREIAERAAGMLQRDAKASLQSVLESVLADCQGRPAAKVIEIARRAYLRQRSLQALWRLAIPADQIDGYPAQSGRIVPPLVRFAQACRQTGFVTVKAESDGVVRRIPLLAYTGQRAYPQFALCVAAEKLRQMHGGSCRITAGPRQVNIRCADGFERVIPVDRDGYLLINWMPRGAAHPQHLPASALALVWRLRQDAQKRVDLRLNYRELLDLANPALNSKAEELYYALAGACRKADDKDKAWADAECKRQRAILLEPNNVPLVPADVLAAQAEAAAELRRTGDQLRQLLGDPNHLDAFLGRPPPAPATRPATQGTTDSARREHDPAMQAYRYRKDGAQSVLDRLARLPEIARAMDAEVARQLDRIRPFVAGKICLIGSTSTGAADFVPSPVGERTPGVVVHANILNTILTGAFIRQAPELLNILVILLAGAAVSLLAAWRPVLQAGPLVVLLAFAYAAINALVVFGLWSFWLVLVAPLGAMLASFVVVTAYRQLTEERAKRHIKAMFSHALSPALVDRLMEDPSLARLGGEKRVLTCFFSDLAGFTPLSHRLGEQGTVSLLNRYFDRMTEIVQNRCGGYLNKFLGDGIFVFFGAPVFQDDHPARALRAALECQQEVAALNRVLAEESQGQIELSCRIGIATGEVMVGNCGSTQRMDYTAIGDTVNLASRLEGANKFFGTRILAADETWRRRDGEQFLARPLGSVYVVGRTDAAAVWNLIGQTESATPQQRQACADFSAAIDLYRRRKFAEAAGLLESLPALMPGDKATQFYLDLCRRYAAAPPGDDWDSAIQLTEK